MDNFDALGNMTFMKSKKVSHQSTDVPSEDKENRLSQDKSRLVKKYRDSLNRFPLEVFSRKRGK